MPQRSHDADESLPWSDRKSIIADETTASLMNAIVCNEAVDMVLIDVAVRMRRALDGRYSTSQIAELLDKHYQSP